MPAISIVMSSRRLIQSLVGQVQFAFDGVSSSIGHIRAGRLRALGVAEPARIGALPEVSALAELYS